MPKGLQVKKRDEIGIPYAEANDDGSLTCPKCKVKIHPDPLLSATDAGEFKAAATAYGHHWVRNHDEN